MTVGSGLTDKLYWRPYVGGWHCYKRTNRRREWISLCLRHTIRVVGGQSIDRPPSWLRCARCDAAEVKRRGWDEGGEDTITHDQIYELYLSCDTQPLPSATKETAMTATEINTEVLKTYLGRMMRDNRKSGFKLVVCLGPANTAAYKLRVCVWSANQETWSKPQTRELDNLSEIDLAKLTPAQRRTCQRAVNHIERNSFGVVPGKPGDPSRPGSWSSVIQVGRPWFTKPAGAKPPAPGVTKLPTERFSATPDGRKKLQNLNRALSNWAFGGRK